MADTTIDTLLVRIETDLSGLRRGLDQVNKNVTGAGNQARDSFRSMEDGVNRVTGAATKLAGVLVAAVGAAALGGSIVGTIRQFEDLEAQLKSVTPNAKVAADAFELIKRFTATTTFNLDEVTQAFITLASSGIAPTTDVLQDLGNLAAARGQRIQDVAQAVQNATTGEFEMLKRLGVVVRAEGDQITATFNGVATTMNKSGIVDYLRSIGSEKFGDAISNQAGTISGALSNLQDAISFFQVQIGEGGLRTALIEITKTLTESASGSDSLAQSIGRALGAAIRTVNSALIFMRDNLREIKTAIVIFLAVFAASKVLVIATAMFTLGKAIIQVKTAMALLNAVSKVNPVLLIAGALAAVGSQAESVKSLIDMITGGIDDSGNAAKSAAKEIADYDAAVRAAFTAPPEQAPKKFTDALADLREKLASARLQLQGYTKDQIAAFKSAGFLENVKIDGSNVQLTATAEQLAALNSQLSDLDFVNVILGLTDVDNSIRRLGLSIQESELEKEFRALFPEGFFDRIKTMNVDLDGLRSRFFQIKTDAAVSDVRKQMADLSAEMNMTDFDKFFSGLTKGLEKLPLTADALSKLRTEARALFDQTEAIKLRNQQAQNGVSISRQFMTEEEKLAESRRDLTAALFAQSITTKEYERAMANLNYQVESAKPLYQSLENVISSATNSMTSALTSLFSGTAKAKDAFQNMFKGIADMVLQEVTRMLIVIPIMNAIRSALGMPMAPSFTGSMGGATTAMGTYDLAPAGFKLPTTLGSAGGGAMFADQARLVGERGPELFVPHSAGTLVNANNTASMMRGGSPVVVNQTVQITTGVQSTVRAEIQNLLPQIADVTKAAVAQSAMRGGSFRRAFA
jgi:hypothetical protein